MAETMCGGPYPPQCSSAPMGLGAAARLTFPNRVGRPSLMRRCSRSVVCMDWRGCCIHSRHHAHRMQG